MMAEEHLGILFVGAVCAGMATWHILKNPRDSNWKMLAVIGYGTASVLAAHVFLPIPRVAIFAMVLFLLGFAIVESPWIRMLRRR